MGHVRTRRSAAVALIIGTVLTLGFAGCSADSDSGSAKSAADQPVAQEPALGAEGERAADAAKAGEPLGDQAAKPQQNAGQATQGVPKVDPTAPEQATRSIIYTGSITIRVDDVNAAAAKATALAIGAGGVVGGDQRTLDAGRSQATLVLRIPAERFTAVLDDLPRGLGEEESRSVKAEDVTEQIVDLDARIETARASVDRVRALLARAQSLSEIVSLESELSRRESDLNSLLRRKNKLDDLTSLSTITVTLLGPEAKEKEKKEETGFFAGLKAGWKAFVASLVVLLTVLGALLPWLIAIGIPVALLVFLARRAGRRTVLAGPRQIGPYPTAPPAPAPAPGPAPAAPAPAGPAPAAPPAQAATAPPAAGPGPENRDRS